MFWGNKELKPERVSYLKVEKSSMPFASSKWKRYCGDEGAMRLLTNQTVSIEKDAYGLSPKKPPEPKETKAERKERMRKEEIQRYIAKKQWEQAKEEAKAKEAADRAAGIPPEPPIGETPDSLLPWFDLRDMPKSMRKMGYKVGAELLERWFTGKAYTIPADKKIRFSLTNHPIEENLVTLSWARKFGNMENLFKKLLNESVYVEAASPIIRKKVEPVITQDFLGNTFKPVWNTSNFLQDRQVFHKDWQFQYVLFSALDTVSTGQAITKTPTDLTVAVAGGGLYAAIGVVEVDGPKYYEYDNSNALKRYCFEPTVKLTHVYIYLMDDFEFNAKPGEKKSQYLGHWNEHGVIMSYVAYISDVDRKSRVFDSTWGTSPFMGDVEGSKYVLHTDRGPVTVKSQAVYYPIFNITFENWRKKHGHGQDFTIITKPELYKLKKPVVFKIQKICKPWEPMKL